jgi:hypothetical protein
VTSVRRLSAIPVQYLAALLLAALIGGGIYAVRRSEAGTTPAPTPSSSSSSPSASTARPPAIVHMPVTANPAKAARPNGEASKSPKQILADAASAMRGASGFELRGTQSEDGKTTQIWLAASPRSLEFGASVGAAAYEVLKVPTGYYVRGSAGFWKQHLGARGAVLTDRWIHGSSRALSSELNQVTPATLERCLTEDTGRLRIAGTTSINGRPAIVIRDSGNLPGTAPGTLAVAMTGPPYPLRETVAGRHRAGGRIDVCNDGHASGYQTGTLTLSNFNQIAPMQPPADAIEVPGPPIS